MVRVRVWLLAGLECVALVNQLTYQGLAGARASEGEGEGEGEG